MTQVQLQIDGERGSISVDTLITALRRTIGLLGEVERTSRQGEGPRGRWRVEEVWNGSIGVALTPSADIPGEIPEKLVGGLTVLEERPELPPWFSEAAIETVQKMGKILHDPGVSGIGLTAVAPSGTETEARLTPEIIGHTAEAFQGTDEAWGSVAGILDVVNFRRGQRTVSPYDAHDRNAVRCTFPLELLEAVREHLGSTVRAAGIVTRNRVGRVASVKVESLEDIEKEGFVPSVAELTGIAPWYTGERTAVEHQRWTRGAWTPRFYLDSNAYLAWLRSEVGRVDTARELLTAGEEHRMTIVAITLVYAEVCGHREVRSSGADGVEMKIRTFFERGFLRRIEVDLPTARHAGALSCAYGLGGADAIHLSSGIQGKAERFMTWERKDFSIGRVIHRAALQEPETYGQGTLPLR